MKDYSVELELAKELAKTAGEIMRKYFNSSTAEARLKGDKTIVTKADIEINDLVIERVNQVTPSYSVHGEERSVMKDNATHTWVCDPVDGTMPFAKGLPISTFSLALVNEVGDAVLGVAYDPYFDRLYYASKGQGAFLNGEKLQVSDKQTLEAAYIDEELWVNAGEGISFDDPKDVFNKKGAKLTTLCSAVITGCLVAQGAYDAMLFGQGKPEDIAALSVIVTEAGGKVTDLFGNPQRYDQRINGAVVSNGLLHDEICTILRQTNYHNEKPDHE